MTKPARGRPNSRHLLVRAATELLREKGPAAVTARAVARQAGVAEATVFNNFGDLRGLLVALGREGIPEYDTLVAHIRQGPRSGVAEWLEGIVELNRVYMLAALPLSVHQLGAGPSGWVDQKELVMSTHTLLCEQLEKLSASGLINKNADVPAAAMLLVAGAAHAALSDMTAGVASVLCDDPGEMAHRIVSQLNLV